MHRPNPNHCGGDGGAPVPGVAVLDERAQQQWVVADDAMRNGANDSRVSAHDCPPFAPRDDHCVVLTHGLVRVLHMRRSRLKPHRQRLS